MTPRPSTPVGSTSMPYNYKRRKPSIIKNLWIYRRMVLLAMLLGVFLWFIVINNQEVVVHFPFGLGEFSTSSGLAILLGAFAGSLTTALGATIVWAVRRQRARTETPPLAAAHPPRSAPADRADFRDDLPPPDYAARAKEGFPDPDWPAQ